MLFQYSVEFFRLGGSEMIVLLLSEELSFLEKTIWWEFYDAFKV